MTPNANHKAGGCYENVSPIYKGEGEDLGYGKGWDLDTG